jgi:hypothetical protein
MADALLPATVIVLTSFLPAITKWPLPSSHAATLACPATFVLMALIKLPTVSVPVDV